ncbi:STAS domain-containing protein [Turneriella parva]|uniref:Anti-sigma factor antagonist n=1 Tax=Turneriella parva (strain ATCC BAA-1111 / DSM 21527 / NCTC 11395 / H) TaxID=869212 RepID=I4B7K8_TURPD|nr:STAS domain-containing protein [Turneriella parva]AFM13265.1 anti-anti-sigma factor [Turneriella parva DSM 21527]
MEPTTDRPVAILAFSGAIRPHDVYELEDNLASLGNKGTYKVIADLSRVEHLSSSALGVLARFSELCRAHHGELRLVVTEPGVLNLLQVTMLDKVFEIYASLEEAEEDF